MRLDPKIHSTVLVSREFSVLLLLLFFAPTLRAQDAIRPSLAGEAAAEARRQSIEQIPYNLLAGPIRFRFSATTGIEYNDNINLAETNREAAFIIRPQFNIDAIWPVTQLNTLRLDLGVGYNFYTNHGGTNPNSLIISPGSQIGFDIFVQDFRINIHDRFLLQQDPITQIQLSNVVDYGRFENTVGVSVLWDLNKAVLTFSYDHYLYVSTTDSFSYLDRNAEAFVLSAYFALTSTTGAGLEANFVYNYYSQQVLNNSVNYSVGPFIETQLTNYLKLRASAGYQVMDFASGGSIGDTSDGSTPYGYILLAHRLNPAISQTIAAGHELQLGVNSNFITVNWVRHTATWNIVRRVLLATEAFYETGDDSGTGPDSENIQRYGGAITAAYQLTPHVTVGLRYQYTQKQSDLPGRDYKQSRVSLDGTYAF